jgi:hypothetical protein
MNPFLETEDAWQTFHNNAIAVIAEHVNRELPPNYFAKTETALFIHEPPASDRLAARADEAVTSTESAPQWVAGPTSAGLVEAPLQVEVPGVSTEKRNYLEIYDKRDRQPITVVELLSPSNKKGGSDYDQYLTKRLLLHEYGVHLLEIDLLRMRGRMPMEPTPNADYLVLLHRRGSSTASVWPIKLRQRLPTVPVPLKEEDESIRLDLQQVLHDAYDHYGYTRWLYLDGMTSIKPPLSETDQTWARALMPE